MADNDHTIIQDLKADERPRERLIKHGPAALRNAELLAILIGSGSTTEMQLVSWSACSLTIATVWATWAR